MTPKKDKEYVLKSAKEHGVRFIRLWFTDILGLLKSFAINVEELEGALEEGMGFDGASIEGFARVDESDMIAMPDPSTFSVLPWRPKENAVARMFCDIQLPDSRPYPGDSRQVLKRNLRRARRMGYTFYVGSEMEFYCFKDSQSTQLLDRGGYFDLTPLDSASDVRRDAVLMLEEMGVPVESSHHEAAPSQHEIDLRYTDALTMADSIMTFRLVVKEVAQRHGAYASFMPKPIFGQNGSGMHVHQSLFRGNRNAFYDARDRHRLSGVAKHYMAGLLRHAPEYCAITNQWGNSYKRLVPEFEAPVYVSWAVHNHSDMLRVPRFKTGDRDETRVELRLPDPAANPYLAFSVMLAAGLEGIEKRYPLPQPMEESPAVTDPAVLRRRKVELLPSNLGEAIDQCEKSALVREALGATLLESYIRNKRLEWERYRGQLTAYEMEKYLPVL